MSPREVVARWARAGRRLDVPGAGTTVWSQGAGEPVVCLHGVPASSYLYRKVLPELAARGRRGIAFDLPGLGLADRPTDSDQSWSGLAAWCERAVDALGLDRFGLVVHDIGGPVGFDLVRRVPGRITSLTVLNTMVGAASFRRPWVMEPFARRGIGEAYLATMTGPAFELLMRRIGLRDGSTVPAEEIRAYVPLLKRGDGGRAFLRTMRAFERTEEFEGRIRAALAARDFPARVAWGAADPALALEVHGRDVMAALGLDEVHRLDGRHFVQEDAPAEIAELAA